MSRSQTSRLKKTDFDLTSSVIAKIIDNDNTYSVRDVKFHATSAFKDYKSARKKGGNEDCPETQKLARYFLHDLAKVKRLAESMLCVHRIEIHKTFLLCTKCKRSYTLPLAYRPR